jgi:hypothetical protein
VVQLTYSHSTAFWVLNPGPAYSCTIHQYVYMYVLCCACCDAGAGPRGPAASSPAASIFAFAFAFPTCSCPPPPGAVPAVSPPYLWYRAAAAAMSGSCLPAGCLDSLLADGAAGATTVTKPAHDSGGPVLRCQVATGVWSLHKPLDPQAAQKPVGYQASSDGGPQTHERPDYRECTLLPPLLHCCQQRARALGRGKASVRANWSLLRHIHLSPAPLAPLMHHRGGRCMQSRRATPLTSPTST